MASRMPPPVNQPNPSWTCFRLPWFDVPPGDMASSILQVQIAIVFILTQTLHYGAFKHIGLPHLVSQMIVGLIMSPSSLYPKHGGLHHILFPHVTSSVWRSIGLLGLCFSSFMVIAQVDYGIIWKTGRKSYVLGILGFFIPFGVTAITVFIMNNNPIITDNGTVFNENVIMTSSVTSSSHFPVITCLLNELDMLNSEIGRLAMSTALISEVGGTFFLIAGNHMDRKKWIYLVGPAVTMLVALFGIRPLMKKMCQLTPKDRPVKTTFITLMFLFGLVSGLVTQLTGDQFVLLGLFILAVVTPAGPPLTSSFVRVFDPFVHGLLQPFFVTTCVMRANVFHIDFYDVATWQHITVIVLPGIVRLCLCLGCALLTDMSVSDGFILGLLLNAKGFIDLSVYSSGLESQFTSEEFFTILVYMSIVTATVVPLLVNIFYSPSRKYAGYQKRDIMHLKQSNELRILPCIYRTDNATAITNLLEICNPTMNNPIVANILHLVKLEGRAQSLFISHDLQTKKSSSQRSYSDDIVTAFEKYHNNRDQSDSDQGGLTTHLFTSVTLTKTMHDDICTLALNTITSLIILPFHRKIGIGGSIDSEHNDQRSLNLTVLDHAPCSIAIHVNRGLARKSTNQEQPNYSHSSLNSSNATMITFETENVDPEFNVAVVFIGGNDDQEAVELSKWMARGFRVRIRLVRLMAAGGDDCKNKDVVDSMVIEDMMTGGEEYKKNINYEEITVNDGGETAAIMRTMANDFDLMIVGRRYGSECRQTAGLNEWSEVRELGVIGDLLASPDLEGRTSVLIVQKQKQSGPKRSLLV